MPQLDLGAIVVYAIVALVGLLIVYINWSAARELTFSYWLYMYGAETQAEIIKHSGMGGAKGGGSYFVQYCFQLPSEDQVTEYTAEQGVSRSHFSKLHRGDRKR